MPLYKIGGSTAGGGGGSQIVQGPTYSPQVANQSLGGGDPAAAPDYSGVGKLGLNFGDLSKNATGSTTPPEDHGGFFAGILGALGGTFGEGGRAVGETVGKVLEVPVGLLGGAVGAVGGIGMPFGSEIARGAGKVAEAAGITHAGQAAPILGRDVLGSFAGEVDPKTGERGRVTIGGEVMGLLTSFGLLSRAVERRYAEGALLAGGEATGPAPFFARREALPADLKAQLDSGKISAADALDELVMRGAGYSDNPIVNIAMSVGLDPMTVATLGVGLTGKAAEGAAKVSQFARGVDDLGLAEKFTARQALSYIGKTTKLDRAAQAAGDAEALASVTPLGDMAGLQLSRLQHMGLVTVGRVPGFEQVVVPVANFITRFTDPLKLFGGGNIGKRTTEHVAMAVSAAQANAFGVLTVRKVGGWLGEDITNRLMGLHGTNALQRIAINSEADDVMRNGSIPLLMGENGVAATPTGLIQAQIAHGGFDANVGGQIAGLIEREMPFLTHLTPAARREQTIAKLAEMGGDVSKVPAEVSYKEAVFVHAMYYDHMASKLVDEVVPALKVAADLPADIHPERLTVVAERTFTTQRLPALEAALKAEDGPAVRKIIAAYDDFNHISEGLIPIEKNADLFEAMRRWVGANRDGLLFEVPLTDEAGVLRTDLPKVLADWAENSQGYGYRLANAPPVTADPTLLYRLTRDESGRILHARPWLDYTSDVMNAHIPGRVQAVRQMMFSQIRTERILWQAQRTFVQNLAKTGISENAGRAIYRKLMYTADAAGVTPRGLDPKQMYKVATDALKSMGNNVPNNLTETEIVNHVLVAFRGDFSQVGVTQWITGTLKANLPGHKSNFWGGLAEDLYPKAKFKYAPWFMAQEWSEPYILAAMKGTKVPLRKGSHGFIEALALRNAFGQVARRDPDAAMEVAEVQNLMVRTADAVHATIGKRGGFFDRLKPGLWGDIALRKEATEGLLIKEAFGAHLRKAFNQMSPGKWEEMERHFQTTNAGDVAFNWMAENFKVVDKNGEQVGALVDLMNPHNIGQETRIVLGETKPGRVTWMDLAGWLGRTGETADVDLMAALKSGAQSRAEFIDELTGAGIDPVFAERAHAMATGPSIEEFYRELPKAFARKIKGSKGKAENTAASRAMIQVRAASMGISEDEFIKTHFILPPERSVAGALGGFGPDTLLETRARFVDRLDEMGQAVEDGADSKVVAQQRTELLQQHGITTGNRFAPWGSSHSASSAMTAHSGEIMGFGKRVGGETLNADAAKATRAYLRGIAESPGADIPLYSGRRIEGSAVPSVGDVLDRPLTATTASPGTAQGFSVSRDSRNLTPGYVYEFAPGTRATAHASDEYLTAGRFKVDAVEDVSFDKYYGYEVGAHPDAASIKVVRLSQTEVFDPATKALQSVAVNPHATAQAGAERVIGIRQDLLDVTLERHSGSLAEARQAVGDTGKVVEETYKSRVAGSLGAIDRSGPVNRSVMDELDDASVNENLFNRLAVTDPEQLREAAGLNVRRFDVNALPKRPSTGGPPVGATRAEEEAHYAAKHVAAREWDYQVSHGVATGQIDPKEASLLGWNEAGFDGRNVLPLPSTPLYHATMNMGDIAKSGGLKTRDEAKLTGLGGGTSNTISLTSDKAIADRIAETFREVHKVLNGKITVNQLLARAKKGGFRDKFVQYATGGQRDPVVAERLFKEVYQDHVAIDVSLPAFTEDGRALRPIPPDKIEKNLFDAYRGFLTAQEVAGGPMDPMFFMPDIAGLKAMDPSQIGVVEVTARPGAMGTQVSAMGEWRTWSGDAFMPKLTDDQRHVEDAIKAAAAEPPKTVRAYGAGATLHKVGLVNSDDLKEMALTLDPKVGLAAKNWYVDMRQRIIDLFGNLSEPFMRAFGVSQASTSPVRGIGAVMHTLERLFSDGFAARSMESSGIGKPLLMARERWIQTVDGITQKTGELNEANIVKALFGEPINDRFAAKLNDFLDSLLGNTSRRWTGRGMGLQPAAIDRWTARDMGLLDGVAINHMISAYPETSIGNGLYEIGDKIVRPSGGKGMEFTQFDLVDRAGNLVDREGNVSNKAVSALDFTGAPNDLQYERGVQLMNDAAKKFNEHVNVDGEFKGMQGVWGRTDWTAAEVQAVGWTRTQKVMGGKAEDALGAFNENTFAVAGEIGGNAGSDWAPFAAVIKGLPEEDRVAATDHMYAWLAEQVRDATGVTPISSHGGIGRWQGSPDTLNAINLYLSSPAAADTIADMTSLAFREREVWVPHFVSKSSFKTGMRDFLRKAKKGEEVKPRIWGEAPFHPVADFTHPLVGDDAVAKKALNAIADELKAPGATIFKGPNGRWVLRVIDKPFGADAPFFERLTADTATHVEGMADDVKMAERYDAAVKAAGLDPATFVDDLETWHSDVYVAGPRRRATAADVQKAYDAGDTELGQRLQREVGVGAGGSVESGGAVKSTGAPLSDLMWETHLEDALAAIRRRGGGVDEPALRRLLDEATGEYRNALDAAGSGAARRAADTGTPYLADRRAGAVLGYTRRVADDPRVVIGAFARADPVTGLHELAHVFATDLDQSARDLVIRARATAINADRTDLDARIAALDAKMAGAGLTPAQEATNSLIDRAHYLHAKPGVATSIKAAMGGGDWVEADVRRLYAPFISGDTITVPEKIVPKLPSRRTIGRLGAQKSALAHDLGEFTHAEQWGVQHEEWFVDQFHRWVKGSDAPRGLEASFQHFRNWIEKVWDSIKGKTAQPEISPEMKGLFDEMFSGRPRVPTVNYNIEEHAQRLAGKQALMVSADEAFTNQYFKQGRSFLERSINHPFLGLYPFSYMWGKILPEMFKFLALRPFGFEAPMLGWNTIREVNDTVASRQLLDPAFADFMTANKDSFSAINAIAPMMPNDALIGNVPLWARRISQQGLENADRQANGQPQVPVDYSKGIADSAQYVFGPAMALKQFGTLLGSVGDVGRRIGGMPNPGDAAKQAGTTKPPTMIAFNEAVAPTP